MERPIRVSPLTEEFAVPLSGLHRCTAPVAGAGRPCREGPLRRRSLLGMVLVFRFVRRTRRVKCPDRKRAGNAGA